MKDIYCIRGDPGTRRYQVAKHIAQANPGRTTILEYHLLTQNKHQNNLEAYIGGILRTGNKVVMLATHQQSQHLQDLARNTTNKYALICCENPQKPAHTYQPGEIIINTETLK